MKAVLFSLVFSLFAVISPAQSLKKHLRETDRWNRQTWTSATKMQTTTIDSIPFPTNENDHRPHKYYSLTRYSDSSGTRLLNMSEDFFDGVNYYFKNGKPVFVTQTTSTGNKHIAYPAMPVISYTLFGYLQKDKILEVNGHFPDWLRVENKQEMDSLTLYALLHDLAYFQSLLNNPAAHAKPGSQPHTWTPQPDSTGTWPEEITWQNLHAATTNKALPAGTKTFLPAGFYLSDKTLESKTYHIEGPNGHGGFGGGTTVYYLKTKNIFYLYSDCIQGHIDSFMGPFEGNPKKILARKP